MLRIEKSIEMVGLPCGGSRFSNFIISCPFAYGKLEKQLLQMLWDHTERLLARHSASKSETWCRLCHVNRWERGTPHAPSVFAQQTIVNLLANSALECT